MGSGRKGTLNVNGKHIVIFESEKLFAQTCETCKFYIKELPESLGTRGEKLPSNSILRPGVAPSLARIVSGN